MASTSGKTDQWGRMSLPSTDPDAWPKVSLPTRSKSNNAVGYDEEEAELNAQPPLLKTRRHSAYFDALQQLDEQSSSYEQLNDSGTERTSWDRTAPAPNQWGYAAWLRSVVRRSVPSGRSSGESQRSDASNVPTSPSSARRRTVVSGEGAAVSALVLHRTGSGERAGALKISTEGCERPKAGAEGRGGRKAPSSQSASAFAFVAPEPFVQYHSAARLHGQRSGCCPFAKVPWLAAALAARHRCRSPPAYAGLPTRPERDCSTVCAPVPARRRRHRRRGLSRRTKAYYPLRRT